MFVVPTPCIVPVPSNVSNLVSTEVDNAVWEAKLAENEVAADALLAVTLATLALNWV